MTEESIRTLLLGPYLARLGIAPNEVELEKTLHLRLGRTVHEVQSVTGRADMLVRDAEGNNLFIVEVKREGLELTDDDRDQGISYARLLDQIAPFVLVTNGAETHLYDTISRLELTREAFPRESAFFSAGRQLAADADLRIRWEALRHFVGYSHENVRAFSRAQVEARIRPLLGLTGHEGKYVRDLYVPRPTVRQAIDAFLSGTGSVFALLGESGVGKTNEMCALAERLSQSHIVTFFHAGSMTQSPGDELLEEFNWEFSQALLLPELMRRLTELAESSRRAVVVVVDALDEAETSTFPREMSDLARRVGETAGAVRLIVSAKESEWARFSWNRGVPTGLQLELDGSWASALGGDGSVESAGPRPMVLGKFSEDELQAAQSRYKEHFGLGGFPEGSLRALCKLPFFLRVVSEVYEGKEALPQDMSGSQLVQHWIDRKLETTREPDSARRDLYQFAGAVYERALDGLGEHQALRALESVAESRLEWQGEWPPYDELVKQGFLVRSLDEEKRGSLRFYHSQVRDYLMARHVLRLGDCSSDEFRSVLPELLSNHVLQGALAWHVRESPGRVRELSSVLRGRAFIFLRTYEGILDQVVPGLRGGVEPFTTGQIGLAYEPDDFGLRSFGFFPIGEATEEQIVEIRPTYDGTPHPFARKLWDLGGSNARGGGRNFSNTDPAEAGVAFAHGRIEEALSAGALSEDHIDTLLVEKVLAICSAYRDRLELPDYSHGQHRQASLLPLSTETVQRAVQRYFGGEYYRRAWADTQIRLNSEYVERSGSTISLQFDPIAIAEGNERASAEAEAGATFPPPNVIGEEDLRLLPSLLTTLQARGLSVIEEAPLPAPDLEPPYDGWAVPLAYSDEGIATLIRTFFKRALAVYQLLVEANFPGLKSWFAFYQRLPCTVVASYERPSQDELKRGWGRLVWAACPKLTDSEEPIVRIGPPLDLFVHESGSWPPRTVYGHQLKWGYTVSDLQNLLMPSNEPGYGRRSAPRSAREAPLRAFAYDLLQRDFREVQAGDLAAALERVRPVDPQP